MTVYGDGTNPYLNGGFMGNIVNSPSGALDILLTEGDTLENRASDDMYVAGSVVGDVDNTIISDGFLSDINGEGGQSVSNSRIIITIGSRSSWYIVSPNGDIPYSFNDTWRSGVLVGPNAKIASGSNHPVYIRGFEV